MTGPVTADPIHSPPHYVGAGGLEAIDVLEAQWGWDCHLPTAVAYILRHRRKGRPREDLRKARWWLARLHAARQADPPGVPQVRALSRFSPDQVAAEFGLSANLRRLLWDLETVSTSNNGRERSTRLTTALAWLDDEIAALQAESPA